jgi:hypothetical protein
MSATASPLSVPQVQRAVDALLNHMKITKSKTNQLFEEETPINILFAFKKIPETFGRVQPYMMSVLFTFNTLHHAQCYPSHVYLLL